MSSPSKRRAARREWMQKQTVECQRLIAAKDRDLRQQIDRITTVVPRDREVLYTDDGGMQYISTVDFPKSTEACPYHRVPLDQPPASRSRYYGAQSSYDIITFRSVEYAYRKGNATLRWISYEPTDGSKEGVEITRTLFKSQGKLARALSMLQHDSYYRPSYETTEAIKLLTECVDDLRVVARR